MKALRLLKRGRLLEFVYSGPFEREPILDLARAVRDECAARAAPGALVDITGSVQSLSADDRVELGILIARILIRDVPVAVLTTPREAAEGKFWALVSQNRGLRARVFVDRAQAEGWLVAVAGKSDG